MTMSDRDTAAGLARRIPDNRLDPSKVDDEAGRPAGDKSPAYANALMSEAPASSERGADLDSEPTGNS